MFYIQLSFRSKFREMLYLDSYQVLSKKKTAHLGLL
jgi:hypothetical protein